MGGLGDDPSPGQCDSATRFPRPVESFRGHARAGTGVGDIDSRARRRAASGFPFAAWSSSPFATSRDHPAAELRRPARAAGRGGLEEVIAVEAPAPHVAATRGGHHFAGAADRSKWEDLGR